MYVDNRHPYARRRFPVGSLIGANTIVGGSISRKKNDMSITLNLVDVAGKKAINSVNMSTRSQKDVLIATEFPALVKTLMSPGTQKPSATASLSRKKSIFTNPFLYIGTFVVGGGAAGTYYYKYHYNNRNLPGNPGGSPVVDPPDPDPPTELSIEDAPERTR